MSGVQLIEIPHGKRGKHGPHVWAELTMAWKEPLNTIIGAVIMRNTFNITLQIDIMSSDTERQQVFVELVTDLARKVYGQAAMLSSKRPPKLTVSHIGPEGRNDLKVFEGDEFASEDDE